MDTGGVARGGLLRQEVHFGPALSAISRRRIEVILGLGVLFRVVQYLANRSLWLDEGSLAANITREHLGDVLGFLAQTQLAPPGFLVVEWVAYRTLGDNPFALRLFPLLCGIASLFLFLGVARHCLRPRSVWIAVALFAVSDDLIYFSSELKQYSTDVAAGLVCTLMGMEMHARPATRGRVVAMAAVGATIVWFSHPSVFVLAGVGTVLLATGAAERGWKGALIPCALGLVWGASFAAVYSLSMDQLGHRRDMWRFWAFAFPPIPPASLWDATWVVRRFLYLFVNPLNFETPLGARLSALPAFGLFVAGCLSLGKRDKALLGMLALPFLFALLASCLRLYPFHGRLVLFLVPSLLLLIAEGAGWSRKTFGGGVTRAILLGTLLLFPNLGAFYHLFEMHDRSDFSPYGDRRPANLDPYRFPF